jgi:hypothetical protein
VRPFLARASRQAGRDQPGVATRCGNPVWQPGVRVQILITHLHCCWRWRLKIGWSAILHLRADEAAALIPGNTGRICRGAGAGRLPRVLDSIAARARIV